MNRRLRRPVSAPKHPYETATMPVVSFAPFFAEVLDKELDPLTVSLAYWKLSVAGFFTCRW